MRKIEAAIRRTFAALALASVAWLAAPAAAQDAYPDKPIKVVHGATAGALDTMTRALFAAAEKEIGQTFVKIGRAHV